MSFYIVRNGERVELPFGPGNALEVAEAHARTKNAGYEMYNQKGQVVASIHPKRTQIMPWAKVQVFGLKG